MIYGDYSDFPYFGKPPYLFDTVLTKKNILNRKKKHLHVEPGCQLDCVT